MMTRRGGPTFLINKSHKMTLEDDRKIMEQNKVDNPAKESEESKVASGKKLEGLGEEAIKKLSREMLLQDIMVKRKKNSPA